MLIKKTYLILSFFILPFISNGQEESAPKVDPNKSWGLGLTYFTPGMRNSGGTGLTAFYQINRKEFEIGFLDSYSKTEIFFKYGYYPNDWKKRFDLKAESQIGINFYKLYGRDSYYYLSVGYGMRFKILKQLFLSHSGMLGAAYSNRFDHYSHRIYFQQKTFVLIEFQFKLSFNIGGFKWKKR